MSKASQVFVSHSESDSDKEPVDVLIRSLQGSGYLIRTGNVPQDDKSSQELVIQQIQEAQFFLIVLSEESVRTDRVQAELALAAELRKRVIAAVVGHPEVPSHMVYALAGVRRVNLSTGLHPGVARVLEEMAADSSPGTVIYKPDRLAAICDFCSAAIDLFLFILISPFLLLWMPLGRPIWQHLGADYRSLLASWVARWHRRLEVRFGIWNRHDLKTRGVTLRTEYKRTEAGRIVSEWRDPVSNELYSFRSGRWDGNVLIEGTVSVSSASIGLKTITVYANPENLSRYYMDLPFLSKEADNAQAVKTGNDTLLSYSEQNSDQAIALSLRLKAEGFTVFDLREMRGDEIFSRSETLVLIIPPPDASDLASRLEDLRVASYLGKRIVPVSLGNAGAVPLGMQYALAGIQLIDLGDDLPGSTGLLLKALGRTREVSPTTGSGTERQNYPVRTRFTGAWIGALCYGFGSILPAFLMHGRSREEALLGGLIAGLVWGACAGGFMQPRIENPLHWILYGMFFVLFGLVIYFEVYGFSDSFIRAEKPIESMRGEAAGATLVGFLVFFAGKLLEDRFLIRRLRKRGKLLLTEYRRFDPTHIVSEWCDPETREVHVFQGRTRGRDISKLVRTATIVVFVNPDNLSDYYMDFSVEPVGVAGRAGAASIEGNDANRSITGSRPDANTVQQPSEFDRQVRSS